MIIRKKIFHELKNYLNEHSNTAGFCYLRGRRRVGKSTCLESLSTTYPKIYFYFMGRPDEKASKTLVRCSKSWDQFTGNNLLSRYRTNELNWDLFFESIVQYGQTLTSNICLVFDEIQWIAKEQSGFLGAFKQHWIKIEKIPYLKIIICGSSNKFFHKMTGGEEKLIRGLKTRSDIWLKPLSLKEVKEYYKPNFSDQELLLAYSFFGGIPYYWNQIPSELNFIQAVNKVCFTPKSLFLEEYREMLNLEFQANSIKNLVLILEQIKGSGKTASAITQDARLPHSTVGDLLTKLENYSLVFTKKPLFGKPKEIQRGSLFYMKDFYLNFYFRILSKYKNRIQRNKNNDLIFSQILEASQSGYFIQDYTGHLFELLIQYILENSEDREENIFEKLQIKNCEYEIGFHWDKTVQFDLILHKSSDRIYRFIECKWTQDKDQILNSISTFSDRVSSFSVPHQMALCLNYNASTSILKAAKVANVTIISPEDLFCL
jgi:hypothetical protein